MKICQGEQKMYLIKWNIQGQVFLNHYTQGYSPLDPDRYLFWLKKLLREVNNISENQNCHAEP